MPSDVRHVHSDEANDWYQLGTESDAWPSFGDLLGSGDEVVYVPSSLYSALAVDDPGTVSIGGLPAAYKRFRSTGGEIEPYSTIEVLPDKWIPHSTVALSASRAGAAAREAHGIYSAGVRSTYERLFSLVRRARRQQELQVEAVPFRVEPGHVSAEDRDLVDRVSSFVSKVPYLEPDVEQD